MRLSQKASEIDDLWFLSIILLFLIINWNMPMASIYSNMVHISMWGYILPIVLGLFVWIPLSNKQNRMMELIAGIVSAIGFVWAYKRLTNTPMAAVFATTALGESVYIHKLVFGGLIPIVETVFFFVILPLWALWKMGKSLDRGLFSMDSIITIIAFAAIFTIFHMTAKGITNNMDLLATFLFGALSMGLIIYFQSVLPALILHITVNSYSIELFKTVTTSVMTASPLMIMGVIGIVIYLISSKRVRFPFAG